MRRLKVVVALWLVLAATAAAAQDTAPSDDRRALAKELVDAVGMVKLAGQLIGNAVPQAIASLKRANPTITDEILAELQRIGEQEVKTALPEFADAAAAIYEGIFSTDELRQLIAFYRSPVGRKVTEQLPEINRQATAFGQVWGRRVGERIAGRLKALAQKKGYAI